MPTKLQVIYDVKETLKKYSDDSDYENRHILYLYNLKRAKFLRQLLDDKTRNFDAILMQSFCLGFEEVSKDLCGITSTCTVLRSVKPLPRLLQVKNRSTLISAQFSEAFTQPLKVIDFLQAPYILDKPYNSGTYLTIDSENYAFIISKFPEHKLISCLYFTGIFEDPSELEDYDNCCSCETVKPCFEDDDEYPAQSFLIDLIRDELVKLFITTKEQVKEDRDNNSNDD